MKVLLDECVPFIVKQLIPGHSVYGVRMMGWSGVKNGELIRLADDQFDVFVTIDKNLSYQQDLSRVRMAIVLVNVDSNRLGVVMGACSGLGDLINRISKGRFYSI